MPANFTHSLRLKPLQLTHDKYAVRVPFWPMPGGKPGIYTRIQAPPGGEFTSLALTLSSFDATTGISTPVAAAGDLMLSTVDPSVSYDGFFLHTVLEDVPLTSRGPKMWRATRLHGCAYSTIQVNNGWLFIYITGGPTALNPDDPANASNILVGDLAMTVITD